MYNLEMPRRPGGKKKQNLILSYLFHKTGIASR